MDVQWIKLSVDMFDNRKIRHLRKLPEGDSIVLIWVMLLTLAGKCNAGGMIFLTEDIPYTVGMLADELGFEDSTIQLALSSLERFGMIRHMDGEYLEISGWADHQSLDDAERIKEQTRQRVARHREKMAALQGVSERNATSNVTSNVTVTQCNAVDKDKEKEKEKEEEKEERGEGASAPADSATPSKVVELYNSICTRLPAVKTISEARRKTIRARARMYSMEDFETLFRKAEASAFLCGANARNWVADFDWLTADKNMAKVLDGKYDDAPPGGGRSQPQTRAAKDLESSYAMIAEWAAGGDRDG